LWRKQMSVNNNENSKGGTTHNGTPPSFWLQGIIILGAFGLYSLFFPLMHNIMGPSAGAFIAVPILSLGWFFGFRVALFAGVVAIPLSTLLLNIVGLHGWDVLIRVGGGPGFLIAIIMCTAVGYMRDIGKQLQKEIIVREEREKELRKIHRAVRVLSECNHVLFLSKNEQDLLKDICRVIVEVGSYRFVWIGYAVQDVNKTVQPVAQAGFEEGNLEAINISWADEEIGRGPTGTAIRTEKPSIARNILTNSNFSHWRTEATKRLYASSIALPLMINGSCLGVLNIYSKDSDGFDIDEVKLLTELADNLAFGIMTQRTRIEQEKGEEEIRTRVELMDRLSSISENLNRLSTIEDVVINISQAAHSLCESDRAAFYLRQPDDTVICSWSHGLSSKYLEQATTGFEQLPGGQMLQSTEPIIIDDIHKLPATAWLRRIAQPEGYRATCLLPLVFEGKVIAALGYYYDIPFTWSKVELEILGAFTRQAALALENSRLLEETQRRFKRIEALLDINRAITGSLDLTLTLDVLLKQVISLLQVDATNVLLINRETSTLEFTVGLGFRTEALRFTHLRVGEGLAGRALLEQRIIHISDLNKQNTDFSRSPLFTEEEFVSYYGLPLIAKNEVMGVLEIFHRSSLKHDTEWLSLLKGLADQTAIAIENADLYTNLLYTNKELAISYETTLEGWGRALELRDIETEGHCKRVTEMAQQLAKELEFPEDELIQLRRGALLHDIGKMGIPDRILLKPGPLTAKEREIMQKHTIFAHEMLSPIPYLHDALDIPLYHHEKWDGSGYPHSLKGEDIPFAARVFAVVDVWDALINDRPYRKAWSIKKAFTFIREQSGKHFDPQVVEVFQEKVIEPEFQQF
jgi:putative nucleotidyltransferase with HDIG domain